MTDDSWRPRRAGRPSKLRDLPPGPAEAAPPASGPEPGDAPWPGVCGPTVNSLNGEDSLLLRLQAVHEVDEVFAQEVDRPDLSPVHKIDMGERFLDGT